MSSPTITPRMPRTAARIAMAVATAGLAAGMLTGCFQNPVEKLVENGVEDAIKSATGGDVSLGGDLPEGFPAAVAIVDGKIMVGLGTGGAEGWVVVVQSDDPNAAEAARAKLEGAGFAQDSSLSDEQLDALTSGQLDAAVYANDQYRVLLAVQDGTVSYTVTPK
ncbi:hypothetical protein BJ978_003076 [Agromyces terreus]|uniref:Uncharacterized protein n=1 Tax=Agromyces terreus TaxID=424795 RepID=A0A9X2KDK8_9MICO|nr:hypothetical protein [Agromyces terreus]MCP2372400.1 hypothetical protein [Agromyces terreus]